MKRIAYLLLLGWSVPALVSTEAIAQEVRSATEVALDSLLMMPVSTAAKYEQKQTEAAAFVTIVTRQDIQDFGYRSLEEVLRAQTGFYSGNDMEYSDMGFRGFGRSGYYNNKLLTLVDGHSVNDNYTGGTRLGSALGVDLDAVERIEIVRGPGSSLYGARAMLAVVNLVTRKGRDIDGVEVVGDLGDEQTVGASVGYGKVLGSDSDLSISSSFSSRTGSDIYFPELDSPVLNHGVAEDLDWERYSRILGTFRSGDLLLEGSFSNRARGIPTGAYKTVFNQPDAKSRDRSMFLEARYSKRIGSATELTWRGYADSYENDGVYPSVRQAENGQGLEPVNVDVSVDARSLGAETRIQWDPALSHRVVFGLEGQRVFQAGHEISQTGIMVFEGAFPYTILSAFVHEEFQITPRLALTMGIRRDQYSTQGSSTTPRGALVYHPTEASTFKLLAGEAFRAPNILEMHINTPTIALLSNPDLEPEKMGSFELVWEQRLGSAATTLSVFRNEIRDLIDLVEIQTPDSLVGLGFGSLMFQQQNISNARAVGFDFEARVALPLGILAKVGYSFNEATDQASGERLVNAPRQMVRFSASGAVRDWGRIGLNLRGGGERKTLYGSYAEAATVVDVTLTSAPVLQGLEAKLIMRNLLNTRYSVPGGFQHIQSAIPQPGRSITIRVGYSW